MVFVYIIYIVLMVIFLVTSALILRHTVKYSYLSPKFKTIVTIFGLLALCVFIFSIYLAFSIGVSPSPSPSSYPSVSPSTSTSDINF